jgi:uncharacterized iron-regulated membrane protein
MSMMRWHRVVVLVTGLLLAYVALTGAGIELADMRALVMHAPETDPDMLLMRQHQNGTANFFVVSAPDYTAAPLPQALDYDAAIHRAAQLGRTAAPDADLRLVELRTYDGKIVAHTLMNRRQIALDLATGEPLPDGALPLPPLPNAFTSPRQDFKALHRFNFLGRAATVPDILAGLAFLVLLVTGTIHYLRVYRQRRHLGRHHLFWHGGGGWWRTLHRWASIISIIVVVSLSITGTLLAINSVGVPIHQWLHPRHRAPGAFEGDVSSPLRDSELSAMTQATLTAFHKAKPGVGIKVLRLRYFAGYPQGIVVADDGDTTQLVYNTATGASMGLSEKGYPDLGFPFGWEWNQRLKRIHRGDILGMSGRWTVTLSALCVVYLSISGIVLYYQAWMRRYRSGRRALLWK